LVRQIIINRVKRSSGTFIKHSNSSPNFALLNLNTFGQIRAGATVSLIQPLTIIRAAGGVYDF
jgi:hypothetical protein